MTQEIKPLAQGTQELKGEALDYSTSETKRKHAQAVQKAKQALKLLEYAGRLSCEAGRAYDRDFSGPVLKGCHSHFEWAQEMFRAADILKARVGYGTLHGGEG